MPAGSTRYLIGDDFDASTTVARFPRLDVADKNHPVVLFAHAVEKMRVDLGRPSLHGET